MGAIRPIRAPCAMAAFREIEPLGASANRWTRTTTLTIATYRKRAATFATVARLHPAAS
jgi:hypothetical protein